MKFNFYWLPYNLRPKNIWRKIKDKYWNKWTTIKPRKLDNSWHDRDYLLIHCMMEIAAQFIEHEGPKTEKEWEWQKENNPNFYESWIKTKEIVDWFFNEFDEDYPWGLEDDEYKIKHGDKNKFEVEEENDLILDSKLKELIDIRHYWWT